MSFNLESEIAKALSNFNQEVAQEIGDIVDDLADDTVSKLRGASPRRTGGYANDWDSKLNKRGERIIYQPKEYRKAHLLEFGHARRNGGRNVGAQPHIKEIENEVIKKFESEGVKFYFNETVSEVVKNDNEFIIKASSGIKYGV